MLEKIIMIIMFIVAFAYILRGAIKGNSGCSGCASRDFCSSENNLQNNPQNSSQSDSKSNTQNNSKNNSSANRKKEVNIPINNLTKRNK